MVKEVTPEKEDGVEWGDGDGKSNIGIGTRHGDFGKRETSKEERSRIEKGVGRPSEDK